MNLSRRSKAIYSTLLGTIILFVFLGIMDDDPAYTGGPWIRGLPVMFFLIVSLTAQAFTFLMTLKPLNIYNRHSIYLLGVISNILAIVSFYVVYFSV